MGRNLSVRMRQISWNTGDLTSLRQAAISWSLVFIYNYFLVKCIKYKYLLFMCRLVKINPEIQNKKVVEKSARIHLEIVYFSVRWMLSGAIKVYLVGYT